MERTSKLATISKKLNAINAEAELALLQEETARKRDERGNKMRIINIFSGFQNAYNEPGWQLWDQSKNLIGVYHTREEARDVAANRLPNRKPA